MSGDDDVVGGEIETPITFCDHQSIRVRHNKWTGGQFLGSLCGEVGIANTVEQTQVLI
jgi:hypothetical protein